MNKLRKDNSYSQPFLFKGAKTEREFSGQQAESKSNSCAKKSKSRDGGYTIIESLVAMIVVSVLMIAIAPVMAFSVATRVQARRMELATQAARAYIDALRTGALKKGGSIPGFPIAAPADNLAGAGVPAVGETYCVDMDGGGCSSSSNKDFYVQGAWLNKNVAANEDPALKGYQLLVRVYRADSFASGVTLKAPKDATKQSVVGSGLGNLTMPVVEMSTEIPATGTPSYKSIFDRLK
ncbi:prepilin-type N-terminal cleavage/methylation domain-containing protein [Microcoleus sp. herbarium14]|uniref:prepilin-type N-terminal cleavage/methylation domain-containing protein n=1 Tax=Microcoleus sp. herbarium14 TaxID=3055439 RepID=UPI002FD29085